MSRTWEDAFDGVPLSADSLDGLRSACAQAAGRALLPLEEIEGLSLDFLDDSIPWTREELESALNRLKMHERRPCDDYAPSQKALARWIRGFCDLSP